jgi:hypothetical protein
MIYPTNFNSEYSTLHSLTSARRRLPFYCDEREDLQRNNGPRTLLPPWKQGDSEPTLERLGTRRAGRHRQPGGLLRLARRRPAAQRARVAMRRCWGGRPVRQEEALGMLAAHYGYDAKRAS